MAEKTAGNEQNMIRFGPSEKEERRFARIRRIVTAVLALVFVPLVIALGVLEWDDRHFYIVSAAIILLSTIPFFIVFEKRRPLAREITLIAVLVALGVAGRAAFYMLPQFKPIAAVVIIAGCSLGCEAGFITGALTIFVSNIFFGQGPWTPWQMFALGLVGFFAGLLFRREIRTKLGLFLLCLYGALSVLVIYGGIVDTSYVFTAARTVTPAAFLAAYASGLPYNLIFAAATVIFLLLLAKPLLNKLARIKLKHGVFR